MKCTAVQRAPGSKVRPVATARQMSPLSSERWTLPSTQTSQTVCAPAVDIDEKVPWLTGSVRGEQAPPPSRVTCNGNAGTALTTTPSFMSKKRMSVPWQRCSRGGIGRPDAAASALSARRHC